jgi:hypothetical protein
MEFDDALGEELEGRGASFRHLGFSRRLAQIMSRAREIMLQELSSRRLLSAATVTGYDRAPPAASSFICESGIETDFRAND